MVKAKKPMGGAQKTFWLALFISLAVYVPLIVYGHGCFQYMGDYNVQQIAFYKLAHEAVKSGNIFWNWTTDLGANFIGSYSFYLLFSPFFWMTLPFPTEMVPYLMGPLLILKTVCAALTSYLYIKRFVRDSDYAVIGSVLYAYSGFMLFNIFFNHFHEACVFFPLMLVALEELVENDRRGWFALTVAINAMVNYWFFIGEVVFVVLYVLVRIITGGWGCDFKKFVQIAAESVIGLLISCFAFLPSVLAIMGNPRTTTDELLTGQLMWIWGWDQRLPAIIQSFFFPPEMPSAPTFFPEMGAKWASLSAWLPLFSSVGVVAFCKSREKNFHKRLIIMSMIISLVPVFNSVFVAFNGSYYARWFYMPILMMSVATVSAVEDREQPAVHEGWKSGLRWCGGFILVFILAVGFTPVIEDDGALTFGLFDDELRFWFISCAALLCLLLTAVLMLGLYDSDKFKRYTCIILSFVTIGFSMTYLFTGKHSREYDKWYLDVVVNGADEVPLPDKEFVRSDFYDCVDNLGMQWGLPNIQCFHSVVPASIMTFYPEIGVKRDVSSKPDKEYRELRDLLSVRWLFIEEDKDEQEPMEGFTFYDLQNGYNIYENNNWLPMGLGFDIAISTKAIDDTADRLKSRYMLYSLILSEEAIARNEDILIIDDEPYNDALRERNYEKMLEARRKYVADSFEIDNHGFTATTDFDKEMLLFFSVPYDRGWSATVNGETVLIERVNYGLSAVRVPEGEAVIRFDYWTPGLTEGLAITAVGLILLSLYLCVTALVNSRRDRKALPDREPDAPMPTGQALEDYLTNIDELPPIPNKEEKE